MSRDRTTRRPAYTLVVVLLTTFLVLGFATVMGGMVVLEWSRARQRTLEAQAAQVVASAQAWSRVHAAELATGQPVVLPVEDLLVPGTSGSATLRPARGEAGGLVECELSVARAGRRLVRVVTWAVAAP
jgi:hypothetical protein